MHDVDRRGAVLVCQFDGTLKRVERVFVAQRDRTRRIRDDIHVGGVVQIGKLIRDGVHVAQRGTHQQELRLRQGKQWNLPRPAAFRIAEIMELVHGDQTDVGMDAFAQRLIGQDLGRAADDRRIGVDMAVARDHADVLAAEHLDQVEELLADQRLDRRGVVGAAAGAQGREMHAQRHQRLARSRRGVQNDVVAGENVHDGLLLMRPWLDALHIDGPIEEPFIDIVRRQIADAFAAVPVRGETPQGSIHRLIAHRLPTL